MKNYLKIATVALPLIFGGCEKTTPKEPVREDYNKLQGTTYTPMGRVILADENGDGSVDVMLAAENNGIGCLYIANGHLSGYNPGIDPVTMTAETRDLASKILKLERDLRFQMDKEEFEKK